MSKTKVDYKQYYSVDYKKNKIPHKLSSHTIQNILHNKFKFKSELEIRFAYLLT